MNFDTTTTMEATKRPDTLPGEVPTVSSIFLQQQTAIDFSCLTNERKCFPCNVDGVTERLGYFLFFELKHGESFSGGQRRMLEMLAALPKVALLVFDCRWSAPNEKNARLFNPHGVQAMLPKQGGGVELTDSRFTTIEDTRVRYILWLQLPSLGSRLFTCSATEFERDYLRKLPEHKQSWARDCILSADLETLLARKRQCQYGKIYPLQCLFKAVSATLAHV
jgi:hypothetical protein